MPLPGNRPPSAVGLAALLTLALLAMPVGVAAEPLRGRVLLDDPIPPSSPITVQLVCAGEPVAATTADDSGRFELRPPLETSADCRLEASAAGYESDAVTLEALPLDPGIAALALQRAGKWNGYALSSTSLAALPAARANFETAAQSLRQGGQEGMARAEEAFALAAEADPDFAEAWYQLGRMRLARRDVDGGREALRRALDADPWYVSPYRPLLLLELGDENWRQVDALSAQLLDLNPYLADIRYYRALAALGLGEVEAAARDAEAIAAGPEGSSFALLYELRGRILALQGDTAEARAAFEQYLAVEPDGPAAGEVRQRLAALEQR